MTTPWSNRDYYARRAENAAGLAAGTVGVGFGAAKLRDAHKEDYPAAHARNLERIERGARRLGASPQRTAKLVRLADTGHPGFRTLATAAALGTVATAGKRIRMHTEIGQQKQLRRDDVSKADYGQELGKIPRYVHLKGIGKCRVLEYRGNGNFRVLDRNDDERLVHRNQMQFLKKGMTMTTSAFGVEHGEISKVSFGDLAVGASNLAGKAKGFAAPAMGKVRTGATKLVAKLPEEAQAKGLKAVQVAQAHPVATTAAGGLLGLGATGLIHHNNQVGKSLAPARDVSTKAREKAAAKHDALPDGSFPIQNRAQLMRARRAVGRAKDPAAARALIRRRAAQLHVSLDDSAIGKSASTSAFGVEHGVSKAVTDSASYKTLVWNKDALGGPHAKQNRKILRRERLKGQAIGLGAGTAAGTALGGAVDGKAGAILGGATGGLAGQLIGDAHGTRRAMRNPRYVAKPSKS